MRIRAEKEEPRWSSDQRGFLLGEMGVEGAVAATAVH
jgi:hypothetical protein